MSHHQGRNSGRLAMAALAGLCAFPAVAQTAVDRENRSYPPSAHKGHFLGFPSPTWSWHGCTATASRHSLAEVESPTPSVPPDRQGTKQRAVTFTRTIAAPVLSWKVRKGWRICGVQATVHLKHPDVPATLVANVGYTSGTTRGSTAKNGRETLKVKIPKKQGSFPSDAPLFDQFRGKVASIAHVREVTVFVRSTKKRR